VLTRAALKTSETKRVSQLPAQWSTDVEQKRKQASQQLVSDEQVNEVGVFSRPERGDTGRVFGFGFAKNWDFKQQN